MKNYTITDFTISEIPQYICVSAKINKKGRHNAYPKIIGVEKAKEQFVKYIKTKDDIDITEDIKCLDL